MKTIVGRKALIVSLLMNCAYMASAQPTFAADTNQSADRSIAVDLPAQRLSTSLEQFAGQAGIQLVYPSNLLSQSHLAPELKGQVSISEGFQRLLRGTGLTFRFVNERTVALMKASLVHPAGVFPTDYDPEPIIVIGSNLAQMPVSASVLTLDAERLEKGGYSSVEDALRQLPQNLTSLTSASVDLVQPEFGAGLPPISRLGASGVNLRGLGTRSTLVLVNGRRRTGSAQEMGGFTDISSIPISQVERIEVLAEGASAIYGADAVAGVINIVLKKQYESTVVQGRYELSNSDADLYRVTLAHTFPLLGGGVSANLTYDRTRPADIRRFIHRGPKGIGDFSDIGGDNLRLPFGQPGIVYTATEIFPGFFQMGSARGLVPGGQNGDNLQPGALVPITSGTELPSVYEISRAGPDVVRRAVRLSGDWTIGGAVDLRAGFGLMHQRNKSRWRPRLEDFNFLVGAAGRQMLVPTENKFNRFGEPVFVAYSFEREFAGMELSEKQNVRTIDANIGLSGKAPLLQGWRYDVDYSYGQERGRSSLLRDQSGSFFGFERVKDVVEGLNVFGDGQDAAVVANNRALLTTLVEPQNFRFKSASHVGDAILRGDLLTLPGGTAQLAIGAQFRAEQARREHDRPATKLNSSRNVYALFAETSLPLIEDVPAIESLNLSLAARYEHFDQNGLSELFHGAIDIRSRRDLLKAGGFDLTDMTGVTAPETPLTLSGATTVHRRYSNLSPTIRLTWSPVADITLHGSWGRSFLTPQPLQQFGRILALDGTGTLSRSGTLPLPPGVTKVVAILGPNPNLKPQVATVKSVGLAFTPSAMPKARVALTYNDTSFDNYIGNPLEGITIEQLLANFDKLPSTVFTQGADGVLLWDSREVNFQGRRSRTLDINSSYGFKNGLGEWQIAFNAARTFELSSRTLPGLPAVKFSDSELGPSKWVGNLFVSLTHGELTLSTTAQHSSGHRVLFPLSATETTFNDFTPNPSPRRQADSYTTFDFQLAYVSAADRGWMKGWKTKLGVRNAFNAAFPYVDNMVGFVTNRVDVRGRVFYLDIEKSF